MDIMTRRYGLNNEFIEIVIDDLNNGDEHAIHLNRHEVQKLADALTNIHNDTNYKPVTQTWKNVEKAEEIIRSAENTR